METEPASKSHTPLKLRRWTKSKRRKRHH